ncbi:MAG: type II secretion system protein [Phycisphaeraceae bacterium]|nr:type II secretion system protein [Phycisphaeraceae bacterium]
MMPSHDSRRFGVTIIELLVTLGVVTLLVALLMPGLALVRRESRSQENLSNLRQLVIGASGYANVSREWLPPAVLFFAKGASIKTRGWDYEEQGGAFSPGVIWAFVGDGRIFQSPDLPPPERLASGVTGIEPFTGYNYNTTYLGSEGALPGVSADGQMLDGWANARLGARPAQVRRPDSTACFGEGGWKDGPNRFMRAPGNSVEFNLGTVYAGGQAFRGRGGTHVAWLDGHASRVSEPREGMHAASNAWLLTSLMDFPRNGFLSDDDSAYAP